MTLKHIDGFDQYRGQTGAALLNALASAGYAVTNGLGMADGRKPGTLALELQVSPGAGGASWSSRNTTAKADLHAVAANTAGRFVAVGDGGAAVTTTDGIAWAPTVLGLAANMRGIKCHGGTFIAVGSNGAILRSTDGQAWSIRTPPNSTANLTDIEWGGNKWVAVGALGSVGVIFVSTDDGLTWSTVTENAGARGNISVRFGASWVVGGVGGQVLKSTDGLTFTNGVFGSTDDVNDVAFDSGVWLAVAGRDVRRSNDAGATWAVAAAAVATTGVLRAIGASNGRWIAGGDSAQLYMSDDTATWTPPAFNGGAGRTIYDVNPSAGTNAGWCLVGAKASGASNTAMIFVSLAPPTIVRRAFTSTSNYVVIGFAHSATARGRIFSIDGLLDMDWPSGISILGQAGLSTPIRNTTYYYEIVIDKAANTVSLYTNDTLDITVPLPAAGAAMTTYNLSWQAENGAVAKLDDLYLLDGTTNDGATLTTRLKPISIAMRLPTSDLDVNWEPSAEGDHWPLVGTLPPSTGSYVSSATPGQQDLYKSSTPLPDGAGTTESPIIAVGLVALAQKSDLDARQLGLVIGAAGNQSEVIDDTLSITPEYSFAVFEKSPGNVAWTPASVLDTPFGVAVRPS